MGTADSIKSAEPEIDFLKKITISNPNSCILSGEYAPIPNPDSKLYMRKVIV